MRLGGGGFRREAIQTLENEQILVSLRQLHVHAKQYHRVMLSSVNTSSVTTSTISPLQHVLCTGNPGRSKLTMNREHVELLRSSEFTWEEVAQILSISCTTLWRRVQELGIPMCKYSDISDHDLDHLVRDIQCTWCLHATRISEPKA